MKEKMKKKIRSVILLAIGAAVVALCVFGLPRLLGFGVSRLFAVWNLNTRTISQAPEWAIWLYNYAGLLLSDFCYAVLLLCGVIMSKRAVHEARQKKVPIRKLWVWFLAPLFTVLFLLAADSVRLRNLHFALYNLPTVWLIAGCEGIWLRGFAKELLAEAGAGEGICRAVIAFLFALCNCLRSDCTPLLVINMLLLGWLLAALSESGKGFALRYGMLLTASPFLFAPVGGGAVFTLLDVSESFFTGGASGITFGFMWTLTLLFLYWLRYTDDINRFVKRIIAKPRPDVRIYVVPEKRR